MRSRDEIYLEILYQALLNIRVAARAGDATQCDRESNHVHNVPSLIQESDEDRHRYYFSTERPEYIESADRRYRHHFDALWDELRAANDRARGVWRPEPPEGDSTDS